MFAMRKQWKRPLGFLKYLMTGFAVTCVLYIGLAIAGEWPVHKLVVLHTNDTHGHPVKFDYYPSKGVGGLIRRSIITDIPYFPNEKSVMSDRQSVFQMKIEESYGMISSLFILVRLAA